MAKKYPSLVLQKNPTDDSIDRVREILFGGQIRKFERHLEQIEKSLKKESDQLKDSTAQQLNSLTVNIKKEIECPKHKINCINASLILQEFELPYTAPP